MVTMYSNFNNEIGVSTAQLHKKACKYDAILDYNTRLSILSLESLQTRRLYADLIYVYKIVFNVVDEDSNVFFKLCKTFISQPNTRGHDFKLYVEHCRM